MATITAANTRTIIWNNFKEFLDNVSFTDSPSIKAAYNDQDTDFPVIILHSAKIPKFKVSLDGSIEDRMECSIPIEIHTVGGLALDRIIDEMDAGLVLSSSTIESDGLQFGRDNFWFESDGGTYLLNRQKIHMKVITLFFEITNLA